MFRTSRNINIYQKEKDQAAQRASLPKPNSETGIEEEIFLVQQ